MLNINYSICFLLGVNFLYNHCRKKYSICPISIAHGPFTLFKWAKPAFHIMNKPINWARKVPSHSSICLLGQRVLYLVFWMEKSPRKVYFIWSHHKDVGVEHHLLGKSVIKVRGIITYMIFNWISNKKNIIQTFLSVLVLQESESCRMENQKSGNLQCSPLVELAPQHDFLIVECWEGFWQPT